MLMLLHGFGGCAGRRTYKASNDGKGCDESSTAPPCTGYKLFVANDKLNVWISFFSFFLCSLRKMNLFVSGG